MKTTDTGKLLHSLTGNFARAACYSLGVIALAGSITLEAAITGQWDFNSGDLSPTTGIALQYLDGAGGVTSQQTVFGTTTTLGLPDIGGQPAHVLGFPKSLPSMGYVVSPNMAPNGGGTFVNQYTLIFDLLFPPASSAGWRALIQINDPSNANDAELFINPAGAIGISGSYQGQVQTNTWHRIAFAVDLAAPGGPLLRKYIDGQLVGQQVLGEGVDLRWALSPVGGPFGETALLFTDNDADGASVQPGFVNSIQVHDVALSSAYLLALGAPTTDSIPTNVTVPVFIASRKPAANAMNVATNSQIEVVLTDGSSPLDTGTIVVKVNSNAVSRTVSSVAGTHTVRSTVPTLSPLSTNTLAIEFTDPGLGPVSYEWSFRVAAYLLDPGLEAELLGGLAAYWKLDDGLTNASATLMVDMAGENHSTITAGSPDYWIAESGSRFGGSLHVDGANVYATINPSASLDIGTNEVSLSLWVKLEQLPSQIAEAFGGIYDSVTDEYALYLDRSARELRFKVTLANGQAARPGIPAEFLRTNEWIHVVGVYDGKASPTVGEARIYLNGELMDVHVGHDGETGTGLTDRVRAGQTAGLGRNGSQASYLMSSTIDDVAVWAQALSVDAIGYLSSGHPVPVVGGDADPLRIVQHPQDRTAILGSRVTFEVVREGGTPPIFYQWKHNGVDIDGATSAKLFVRVEPDAAGQYTVVVQDAIRSLVSNPATLTILSLPDEPAESLSWGLVAHWPLDDGLSNAATNVITDVKGANHGNLFGGGPAAWLAEPQARFGGALQVDGTNVYAVIPASTALDVNENQVTISLWTKVGQLPSTLPGTFGAIYDSVSDAYVLYLDRNNQELRFKVATTGGQAARPGIPEASLLLNQWIHLVGVYDGNASTNAGEARIYLNGVLMDTHVGNDGGAGNGLTDLVLSGQIAGLGRNGPNAESFFNGPIDDIGVWNRALTTNEISYLASGNLIPIAAEPVTIYENNFESYTGVATNLAHEATDADPAGGWNIGDDDPVGAAAGSGVQVINWLAHSSSNALLLRSGTYAEASFPGPVSASSYELEFWLYAHKAPGNRGFRITMRGEGGDRNEDDYFAYGSVQATNNNIRYYDGINNAPVAGYWSNTAAVFGEDAWQHHRVVVDSLQQKMTLYINGMASPVLENVDIGRPDVPVPTGIRFQHEGDSADDGYIVVDDILFTMDPTGSRDLSTTFTEGFESYAARASATDDADPLLPWITAECVGAGAGRTPAPERVQVVDSSVVTPHTGNQCLKLEGGQRANVSFAWGVPPQADVQITWWARVPASVDGTTATYLRMSLYGAEGGNSVAGDKALLGYGSRDATIGDETSLTYFTTAWVDTTIDYTPNTWEEYRLTTHNSEGRYTIVKNPSGASPIVVVDKGPYVGTAPQWGPTFMAAWSSSNGSGHPPVYIDDIMIESLGVTTFSILGGKFVPEGFQLSWESVAGATYQVWRGANVANPAGFANISGDLTGTSFTDTNAPAGGAFYRVIAK